MSTILLDGVTKRFGETAAVSDVSLTVRSGELLAVVGPSGCGKTTLLRLIAGLDRPDEGDVDIGAERVTDRPARERDVGMVFEDFALFPHMTVRENVSFNLRMRGDYDDVDERVRRTTELLEISDLVDRSIDGLSGGQKQRVALGRAIASEPRAFLLDEPLANLDANLREGMQTELLQLQRELDVTTVYVTHDQTEALTLGDRVAVMHDGRVEQVGTPETVYGRPATMFVAQFVGRPTMNCFEGHYDADREAVQVTERFAVPATLDVADGANVVVGVRPEHLRIDPADGADDSLPLCTGEVSLSKFQGAERIVYLDAASLPEITCRLQDSGPDEGETATVAVSPRDVHLFDPVSGDRFATREGEPAAVGSATENSRVAGSSDTTRSGSGED